MCERCGGFIFFGLAEPQGPMLESYCDALRSGWSPDGSTATATEHLAQIVADPAGFLKALADPIHGLPRSNDIRQSLPGRRVRWMWDGEFCGMIELQDSGPDLDLCDKSATIQFNVVPWKRRHGYASRAVKQLLDEARTLKYARVDFAVEASNSAARIVIERNGGGPASASHAGHHGADVAPFTRYTVPLIVHQA